ncbi:hypothetical protein D3C78_1839150 [compost metagenome]
MVSSRGDRRPRLRIFLRKLRLSSFLARITSYICCSSVRVNLRGSSWKPAEV